MVGATQLAPAASRRVAVLIPCLNEEKAIGKVVDDVKAHIPEAEIWVFDNRSTDDTRAVAETHGARVVSSSTRGKGNVVRHMFREVDADIYLMLDGDATYFADDLRKLMEALVDEGVDMVVGDRFADPEKDSFRPFHSAGNKLVSGMISALFSIPRTDVFSGARAFSRGFVRSVPIMSAGFDVETELTLHAATKRFSVHSVPIRYGKRLQGSYSKLNTIGDGVLVLRTLMRIVKDFRPLLFFGVLAGLCALASLVAGFFPVAEFIATRYVTHVPLAILAAGLGVLSAVLLGIGLMLDSAYRYHSELVEMLRARADAGSTADLFPPRNP